MSEPLHLPAGMPAARPHRVSVVLPTYQESASISRVLEELVRVLESAGLAFELIVVDDASSDGTPERVERDFGDDPRVRVLRRKGHRSLAASIRDGVAEALSPVLVVMDADFNHDPRLVPYLVKYLEDFDLVSGSRFAPGGGMYSTTRQVGSFVMNIWIRVLLQTQIQDNLSGFFATHRQVLEKIPAEGVFWGHGDYYFRLLHHVQRAGLRVLEIPAVYRSREGGGSKTPLLRTALRYGWRVIRFRLAPWFRPAP